MYIFLVTGKIFSLVLCYEMRAITSGMFYKISSPGVLPEDTKQEDTQPKATPHC